MTQNWPKIDPKLTKNPIRKCLKCQILTLFDEKRSLNNAENCLDIATNCLKEIHLLQNRGFSVLSKKVQFRFCVRCSDFKTDCYFMMDARNLGTNVESSFACFIDCVQKLSSAGNKVWWTHHFLNVSIYQTFKFLLNFGHNKHIFLSFLCLWYRIFVH